MEKFQKIVSCICGVFGAVFSFMFGANNATIMLVLVYLMAADIASGMFAATKRKNLNSTVLYKGITKKVCVLIILTVVHVLEFYALSTGDAVFTAVVFYYIANEGLSIVENIGRFVPIPQKLKDVLEQLKEDNEK